MTINRFLPNKDLIELYIGFIRAGSGKSDILIDSNAYLQIVQKHEMEIEAYLNDVLDKLGIFAVVKTNRYSLLYDKEISKIQKRSGLNYNTFDLQQFVRQVVMELLTLNLKKLRYYVIGDLILKKDSSAYGYSNSILV